MNLAREDAYGRMRSHGYRVAMQGVAMQRPHAATLAAQGVTETASVLREYTYYASIRPITAAVR